MNTPSCIIYTHCWDIWDHSKKNATPIYFNYGNRYDLQTWINRLKLDKAELETLTISDIDSGKENYDEIMKSNEKLCSDNVSVCCVFCDYLHHSLLHLRMEHRWYGLDWS